MTVLGLWGDYNASPPPDGAALRNAGFVGVIRYVGIGGAAKRLTKAELVNLQNNGLRVFGVVESITTRADAGYAAGVADAQAALADFAGLEVYFATNDKSTFIQADLDYVRGFQSVVGAARCGAYGDGDFLAAVRNAGYARYFWQAGRSPARTGSTAWAHFWQRNGTQGAASDGPANPVTVNVNGAIVDVSNQYFIVGGSVTDFDTVVNSGVAGSTAKFSLAQALINTDAYGYLLHTQDVPKILAAVTALATTVNQLLGVENANHDTLGQLVSTVAEIQQPSTTVELTDAEKTALAQNVANDLQATLPADIWTLFVKHVST